MLAHRREGEGRPNMVRRQLGEVSDDLLGGHPRRQVLQHVVDSDARTDEARLAAANIRSHINQGDQVHSPTLVALRWQKCRSFQRCAWLTGRALLPERRRVGEQRLPRRFADCVEQLVVDPEANPTGSYGDPVVVVSGQLMVTVGLCSGAWRRMWGGWVSNPRPRDYESRALTTELPPRNTSTVANHRRRSTTPPRATRRQSRNEAEPRSSIASA